MAPEITHPNKLMATVYSWLFPEVETVVRGFIAEYPHELFQQNISPGLDELHLSLAEQFCAYHLEVNDWSALSYRYPTSGSSEAIFHLLAQHKTQTPRLALYCLSGEYEGYRAYAESLNVPLTSLSEEELLEAPPGRVFISQPSARDGNLIAAELLDAIISRHQTVLDLAYLGMTANNWHLSLAHPNIEAVVTSFSKPFGLYYHRLGLCFSRQPVASLYASKWFKNAFSIELGKEVLQAIEPHQLQRRYQKFQVQVCQNLAAQGLALRPSDVFLLASTQTDPGTDYAAFKRADNWRFCLTAELQEAYYGTA